MYYIAKKNGKSFRVSDVQAKAFQNAGYTLTAVKAYQTAQGLTVDGACGVNTWAALLMK